MIKVETISDTKCKCWRFVEMYNPLKKNGEVSKLKKYKWSHSQKLEVMIFPKKRRSVNYGDKTLVNIYDKDI